jgi:hypothetical protein
VTPHERAVQRCMSLPTDRLDHLDRRGSRSGSQLSPPQPRTNDPAGPIGQAESVRPPVARLLTDAGSPLQAQPRAAAELRRRQLRLPTCCANCSLRAAAPAWEKHKAKDKQATHADTKGEGYEGVRVGGPYAEQDASGTTKNSNKRAHAGFGGKMLRHQEKEPRPKNGTNG